LEIGYAELEWFDELVFDGAYADFQSRERRNFPTLAEEVKLAVIDKFRNLEHMDVLISDIVDATPDEQADLARQLSTARREALDSVYELFSNPEYDGAFNEREKVAKAYFEEVDKYYDRVDEIFAPLSDPALTSEERSLVFENWRMFQNEIDGQKIVVDGYEFTHEIDRSWGSKTEEERQRRRLRDIAKKPEWLSTVQARRLVEEYPEIAQYLPADYTLYDELTAFKNETKALVEAGELSSYRAGQLNDEAEKLFNQQMIEQGRERELQWINATPLERLALIDNVPPFLEAIMPQYNHLVQVFRANDLSLASTSMEATKIKVAFFEMVAQHIASVPGGAQAFYDLGANMFGDDFDAPDEIGNVLFFNDRFGDL
jgi:hypothetical protein